MSWTLTRSSTWRCAAFLMLGVASLHAQEGAVYLESGLGRRQGDFGTPITTTLDFAYGTVGYATPTFDVSATLPFLHSKASGNGSNGTETGHGDLILRGARHLLGDVFSGFTLDGGLAVKIPTASKSTGFGTGKVDAGGFLEPGYRFSHWQVSVLGGWIQAGNTGGTANTGAYVVGTGLSLFQDRARYTLSFEARGSQFQGAPGAREIHGDMFYLLSRKWALKAGAFAGLTNGGPRNGFGLAVVYWPSL